MIVAVCGKGGVGKTTVSALLIDELARRGYQGRVLVVDGDPAATLHLALNLPDPTATVADVRDSTSLDANTVLNLPAGKKPTQFVFEQLMKAGVIKTFSRREMSFDFISMGQGEGPGCYCSINRALSVILSKMIEQYSLMLIDNEAGLEHLSRYRLQRADFFLVVTTPNRAARSVASRMIETVQALEMEIGEMWMIYNQTHEGFQPVSDEKAIIVPRSENLTNLELTGAAAIDLLDDDPARLALSPLMEKVILCA